MHKRHFEYAVQKAASVRRLERMSAPIFHADGVYRGGKRHMFQILAGVLAFDAIPTYAGKNMERHIRASDKTEVLDVGLTVKGGAFDFWPELIDDGKGGLVESGVRFFEQRSGTDNALAFFLVRLIQRLQRLGSAPAIDLSENGYGRSL